MCIRDRFNRAPAGTCQAMPRGVLELVRAGDRLHQESQGYFDLTLKPLRPVQLSSGCGSDNARCHWKFGFSAAS